MYIHCETCMRWYHAEAVGLEESNISEVVGFKCCRCHRVRIPICPYLDSKSKRQLEEKRMRASTLKTDCRGMEPDSGLISELQKVEFMANPVLPLEGATSLEIETDLDSSAELSAALGGNIMISTQEMPTHVERGAKLPLRKRTRLENDSDTPSYLKHKPETSTTIPCKTYSDTEPCPDLEGTTSLERETDLDSSAELSAALGGNIMIPSQEMPTHVDRGAKLPVRKRTRLENDSDTPSYLKHKSGTSRTVPCKLCSHTEPCPDLCCQTCNIWIHRHCSPWVEDSSGEDGWKCVNCGMEIV